MTPIDQTRAGQRSTWLWSVAVAMSLVACAGGAVITTAPRTPIASAAPMSAAPMSAAPMSAAPTPTASRVLPSRPPAPCLGACPAGTHHSARFQPPLTYTVSDGWFTDDQPTEYAFQIGSDQAGDGIFLFRDPRAHSRAPDCPSVADPTIGTSPAALTKWIASLPGLDSTPPAAVTIGGLDGYRLEVHIAPTWKHACPYSDGEPIVPLIVGSKPGDLDWGVGRTGMLIYVLDAGGGGRIWIDVEAGDHLTFDEVVKRAASVIESFAFSKP